MLTLKPLSYASRAFKNSGRLLRKKIVTIAAGFTCKDGIILCADTQETIPGYVKTNTEKIKLCLSPNYNVAITGAGDGDLIDMVYQEIGQELGVTDPQEASAVISCVRSKYKAVYDEHIVPYLDIPVDERPSIDLLIAVQFSPQWRHSAKLFKATRSFLREIYFSECLGTGLALGKSLIAKLYTHNLPMSTGALIAVYVLKQAKQWVDGCGGNSDIVSLSRLNLGLTRLNASDVLLLEGRFEMFDQAITPILLTCADSTVRQADFEASMKKFDIDMHTIRGGNMEFEDFVRGLYKRMGQEMPDSLLDNPFESGTK